MAVPQPSLKGEGSPLDVGASILAKLKNKAKEANINYQQCLQLFFQEESFDSISTCRQ